MSKHKRTIAIEKPVDEVVSSIVKGVLDQSQSATLKESVDYSAGEMECHVRLIERFSMSGGNYVTMTITFVATADNPGRLTIIAVTGGGVTNVIIPVPWGERKFMKTLTDMLDVRYPRV